MASKAEKWKEEMAEYIRKIEDAPKEPDGFWTSWSGGGEKVAWVTKDGCLRLGGRGDEITPAQALALRDWLTDTFDEPKEDGK